MPPPSLPSLVGVAGGCGIAVGCMALLMMKERDKMTNQAAFIRNAVDLLKQESVTKEMLGDEITVGQASLTDGWTQLDKFNVKVRVPIKGERDNAYLYVYARRKDEKEKLRLYKMEATFEKVANKKLIFFDRTDQQDTETEGEDPIEKLVKEAREKREAEEKEAEAAKKKRADADMTPWQKKQHYVEQMKTWQPQR